MLYQLDPTEYQTAHSLLVPAFPYHLIVPAVLEGNNPGRLLANHPHHPTAAFLTTPEGNFLAGRPNDRPFNTALAAWLQETFLTAPHSQLVLCLHPPEWQTHLPTILPNHPLLTQPRRHYQYRLPSSDTHHTSPIPHPLPPNYTIRRIDDALLNQSGLTIPDHIPSWLQNNWGSVENGLQHGFGFVAIHQDNAIVCWCIADCVNGRHTEIGIRTHPDHRRLGLAAATVAATVQHALTSGYEQVGWHCAEDNIGSWKTAERVGFTLIGRYLDYYTPLT